jgi:multimeric flavodoxin WrbA
MNNAILINCSYKSNGNTRKLINALKDRRFRDSPSLFLPNFLACHDCNEKLCKNGIDKCHLKDCNRVVEFYKMIRQFENIVFVVPVYLNLPTPKILSFLSRLNTYNDVNGRDLFKDYNAYISVIADVSGTQQTASVLMSSLNMLGFNFRGKCITEHIIEWKTGKVRGGYLSEEIPYIEEEVKKCKDENFID